MADKIKAAVFKVMWFFMYCALMCTLLPAVMLLEQIWKGVMYVRGK